MWMIAATFMLTEGLDSGPLVSRVSFGPRSPGFDNGFQTLSRPPNVPFPRLTTALALLKGDIARLDP